MSVIVCNNTLKKVIVNIDKGQDSPDMLTVSVETCFWASHQLTLKDGSREPVHSHNFLVKAELSSNTVSDLGLVMDFRTLKAMLDNIVAEFDNRALDSLEYFRQNNSTAENVAKCIYRKLQPKIPKNVKLEAVRVTEEPGCAAKFTGPI